MDGDCGFVCWVCCAYLLIVWFYFGYLFLPRFEFVVF